MLRPPLFLLAALATLATSAQAQIPCPFGSPARPSLAWQFGSTPQLVSGIVVRVRDGQPIPGVMVELRPASDTSDTGPTIYYDKGRASTTPRTPPPHGHIATTDTLGRFAMTAVPAGPYRIRVLGAGRSAVDTLTVGGGGLHVVAAVVDWRDQHHCLAPEPQPMSTRQRPQAV